MESGSHHEEPPQGQARRSPLTLAHGQHQQNAINVSTETTELASFHGLGVEDGGPVDLANTGTGGLGKQPGGDRNKPAAASGASLGGEASDPSHKHAIKSDPGMFKTNSPITSPEPDGKRRALGPFLPGAGPFAIFSTSSLSSSPLPLPSDNTEEANETVEEQGPAQGGTGDEGGWSSDDSDDALVDRIRFWRREREHWEAVERQQYAQRHAVIARVDDDDDDKEEEVVEEVVEAVEEDSEWKKGRPFLGASKALTEGFNSVNFENFVDRPRGSDSDTDEEA